jgi:hypothetical protein
MRADDGEDDAISDVFDRFAVLRAEKILYAADLARAFSTPGRPWDTRRAKRLIKRSGIGFQLGAPGSDAPWVTTSKRLRERFPDLWELIEAQAIDEL